MPQPATAVEKPYRETFVAIREVGDELAEAWSKILASTFLTVKYGLIDGEGELDRISRLEGNWDSYGAEPVSREALAASRQILKELAATLILPSAIVPSAGGGTSIYFIRGDRTAYIENYNDGTQALVMYGGPDGADTAEVLEVGEDIRSIDVGNRIARHLD